MWLSRTRNQDTTPQNATSKQVFTVCHQSSSSFMTHQQQGGYVACFFKGAHFFECLIQGKEIDFSQIISNQFS